jgi:hypothetical protein
MQDVIRRVVHPLRAIFPGIGHDFTGNVVKSGPNAAWPDLKQFTSSKLRF